MVVRLKGRRGQPLRKNGKSGRLNLAGAHDGKLKFAIIRRGITNGKRTVMYSTVATQLGLRWVKIAFNFMAALLRVSRGRWRKIPSGATILGSEQDWIQCPS